MRNVGKVRNVGRVLWFESANIESSHRVLWFGESMREGGMPHFEVQDNQSAETEVQSLIRTD